MGYMSTTSQPFYNDDNYGEYGGETRSQFGGPHTSLNAGEGYMSFPQARTGVDWDWSKFIQPGDVTMLPNMAGGLMKTHFANNLVRCGIAGGVASGAYTIGNRMMGDGKFGF
jgi:hypothetical protein